MDNAVTIVVSTTNTMSWWNDDSEKK